MGLWQATHVEKKSILIVLAKKCIFPDFFLHENCTYSKNNLLYIGLTNSSDNIHSFSSLGPCGSGSAAVQ